MNDPQDEGPSEEDSEGSDDEDDEATKDRTHAMSKVVLGKRKAKAPTKTPPRKKSEKSRSAFSPLFVCFPGRAEQRHRRSKGGDRVRARAGERSHYPIIAFKLVASLVSSFQTGLGGLQTFAG